jgi:hypothetical protein
MDTKIKPTLALSRGLVTRISRKAVNGPQQPPPPLRHTVAAQGTQGTYKQPNPDILDLHT